MSKNTKKTSQAIASKAAKTLTDPNASKTAKKIAGSALAQKSTNIQIGSKIEDFSSKALQSYRYSKDTKKLAGSVLSQSNKGR